MKRRIRIPIGGNPDPSKSEADPQYCFKIKKRASFTKRLQERKNFTFSLTENPCYVKVMDMKPVWIWIDFGSPDPDTHHTVTPINSKEN